MSFPTVAQEIIGMSGDADGFISPVAETVESADTEATEAGVVSAFGSFETPVEIALGTGSVHIGINIAVVSFLINDKAFSTGSDDRAIFIRFHGADFESHARDFVV